MMKQPDLFSYPNRPGWKEPTTSRDAAEKVAARAPSLRDQVSPEEWQARLDLAACYRLLDVYGMTDLIYNHVTLRIPGTEHLLINLYGLLYKEITATSLAKIDVEGNILWKPDTEYGINRSGFVIHGAIHNARSDVAAVLPTHTRAGMAVSANIKVRNRRVISLFVDALLGPLDKRKEVR